MPPNKHVKEYVRTARRSLLGVPGMKKVRAASQPAGVPSAASQPGRGARVRMAGSCLLPGAQCPGAAVTPAGPNPSYLQPPSLLPPLRQVAEALNIPTGPPRQRYFPQCEACSQKQSAAIRNSKAREGGSVGALQGALQGLQAPAEQLTSQAMDALLSRQARINTVFLQPPPHPHPRRRCWSCTRCCTTAAAPRPGIMQARCWACGTTAAAAAATAAARAARGRGDDGERERPRALPAVY